MVGRKWSTERPRVSVPSCDYIISFEHRVSATYHRFNLAKHKLVIGNGSFGMREKGEFQGWVSVEIKWEIRKEERKKNRILRIRFQRGIFQFIFRMCFKFDSYFLQFPFIRFIFDKGSRCLLRIETYHISKVSPPILPNCKFFVDEDYTFIWNKILIYYTKFMLQNKVAIII